MGVFDDKKFEELDWISQATEPIDSELNDILSSIPEEVEIDYEMFMEMMGDSYSLSLPLDRATNFVFKKHYKSHLTWDQKDELSRCFELAIEGQEILLDCKNKKISGGSIKLIKTTTTMDEKVLEKLLGREGINEIRSGWMSDGGGSINRANEVMDILGKCEAGLRSRSLRKKRAAIYHRLIELFKTNEWKIKDTTLANKVGFWVASYIREGNLAAWSNFCRLKVMTHKGDPIYSMEEVK